MTPLTSASNGLESFQLAKAALAIFLVIGFGAIEGRSQDNATAQINLGETTDLKALVDLVSTRLELNIIYDESIEGKQISIRAPARISADSLLDVLTSSLRLKGFVLVDGSPEGWKRIVEVERLTRESTQGTAANLMAEGGRNASVTEVFQLHNVAVSDVEPLVKTFLTEPGGNSIASSQRGLIIVSDYASVVSKVGSLLRIIDSPDSPSVTEFHQVRHVDGAGLAEHLVKISQAHSDQVPEGIIRQKLKVDVSHDPRTNQLIFIGRKAAVDRLAEIADRLDVQIGTSTEVYSFRFVDADRVDRFVRGLLDEATMQRLYRSVVEASENVLIATTTDEIHNQIERVRERLDVAGVEADTPLRFYKLKHITAEEALRTIQMISGGAVIAGGQSDTPFVPRSVNSGRVGAVDGILPSGPNRLPAEANVQQELPIPPAYKESRQGSASSVSRPPLATSTSLSDESNLDAFVGRVRIAVDYPTNSIIVIGSAAAHRVYRALIDRIDQQRPQVMIEAKVVVITFTDDETLGIEISGGDRTGGRKLFGFSSYGFSRVDPVTGAMTVLPGVGLNGVLVDPANADVILRALASHGRAKVISSPKILVNDNATGVLSSVAEVPFTSVNASQTVATTSFAGFAEAGTTIAVTPHISEQEQLQLEFKITVNNFTGVGQDGIPPPRQTDDIESIATIPDGHTIVVGGLNRSNRSTDVDAIPFLERVPILGRLGTRSTKSDLSSSLYIFLKPVILRDDKFRGLKYLSRRDIQRACAKSDLPVSLPVIMR